MKNLLNEFNIQQEIIKNQTYKQKYLVVEYILNQKGFEIFEKNNYYQNQPYTSINFRLKSKYKYDIVGDPPKSCNIKDIGYIDLFPGINFTSFNKSLIEKDEITEEIKIDIKKPMDLFAIISFYKSTLPNSWYTKNINKYKYGYDGCSTWKIKTIDDFIVGIGDLFNDIKKEHMKFKNNYSLHNDKNFTVDVETNFSYYSGNVNLGVATIKKSKEDESISIYLNISKNKLKEFFGVNYVCMYLGDNIINNKKHKKLY